MDDMEEDVPQDDEKELEEDDPLEVPEAEEEEAADEPGVVKMSDCESDTPDDFENIDEMMGYLDQFNSSNVQNIDKIDDDKMDFLMGDVAKKILVKEKLLKKAQKKLDGEKSDEEDNQTLEAVEDALDISGSDEETEDMIHKKQKENRNYLDKPNVLKASEYGSNDICWWSACSMQGWPTEMEDTYISHHIDIKGESKKGMLFGIFDGYGGKDIALFARKRFKDIFINLDDFKRKKYKAALRQTFLKLDKELKEKSNVETETL